MSACLQDSSPISSPCGSAWHAKCASPAKCSSSACGWTRAAGFRAADGPCGSCFSPVPSSLAGGSLRARGQSNCERYHHSGAASCKGNWWEIRKGTILLATSLSLQGSRLVLWLMARLLMCLGSAPNTWQLPVVLVTAFSMAFTSAALAFAKLPAEQFREQESQNPSKTPKCFMLADSQFLLELYEELSCITKSFQLVTFNILVEIATNNYQNMHY